MEILLIAALVVIAIIWRILSALGTWLDEKVNGKYGCECHSEWRNWLKGNERHYACGRAFGKCGTCGSSAPMFSPVCPACEKKLNWDAMRKLGWRQAKPTPTLEQCRFWHWEAYKLDKESEICDFFESQGDEYWDSFSQEFSNKYPLDGPEPSRGSPLWAKNEAEMQECLRPYYWWRYQTAKAKAEKEARREAASEAYWEDFTEKWGQPKGAPKNAEQKAASQKIQLLLRIAERPRGNDGTSNRAEALAALEKAQELAAKYHLDIDFVVK